MTGSTRDYAKVMVQEQNIAGIKGYQYQLDDGDWVPDELTLQTSWTFEGVSQGKSQK